MMKPFSCLVTTTTSRKSMMAMRGSSSLVKTLIAGWWPRLVGVNWVLSYLSFFFVVFFIFFIVFFFILFFLSSWPCKTFSWPCKTLLCAFLLRFPSCHELYTSTDWHRVRPSCSPFPPNSCSPSLSIPPELLELNQHPPLKILDNDSNGLHLWHVNLVEKEKEC